MSKSQIVDTNVIVRFLVGDNRQQLSQAKEWFQEAEKGKRRLVIKSIVVAEACFVLESVYEKSRQEISDSFEVFLSQKWLKVEDRDVLLGLWSLYLSNLHFVDSFLITWARLNQSEVISFDQKLLKKFKG